MKTSVFSAASSLEIDRQGVRSLTYESMPNLPNCNEDYRVFPRMLVDHGIVGLLCSNNMAARFPASASMQKMANNPQQASMFQRSQFQQSPYGMAVSSQKFDCSI